MNPRGQYRISNRNWEIWRLAQINFTYKEIASEFSISSTRVRRIVDTCDLYIYRKQLEKKSIGG